MDALQQIYVFAQLALELDDEIDRQKMSRLRDKLAQAKGVVKRVSDDIEAAADELIAKEAALLKGKDEAFGKHMAILSDAKAGLDELENELRLFSNDPLASSERPAVWSPDSGRVRTE